MLSPRSTTALAMLCGALALPAAAAANTFTVDPADDNNSCTRGTDERCKTIGQALAAAQSADVIDVKEGTYAEAPTVPADKSGLLIRGAGAADKIVIAGSGTGDTLTVLGPQTQVKGLSVRTPAGAQSAIVLGAANTTVEQVLALRSEAAQNAEPVIDVTAGAATIRQAFVVQATGDLAPGVRSAAAEGLTIDQSIIASGSGNAVALSQSEQNVIDRSQLVASNPAAWALQVDSAADDSSAKKVELNSVILSGGAEKGGGLLVKTYSSGLVSSAGDVTIVGRHLTVAGGGNGVLLDGSTANGGPTAGVGNITATFSASILHRPNRSEQYEGVPLLSSPNSVKFICSAACDGPKPTGDGTVDWPENAGETADDKLFVDGAKRNFLLRADAPVIDKGGAAASGEPDTDVDGSPRQSGAATDIGADEFVNKPPKAVFGVTNKMPRENEDVGFISGSTDPEQDSGGGIAEYRWDFGDGQTGTGPGVAHRYATRGEYTVKLTVVDRQGATASAEPQTITVTDGTAPVVAISSAKATRKRRLTVRGTATDEAGVASVEVSLRLVQRSKNQKLPKARRSQAKTCAFYDGRAFVTRDCKAGLFRPAKISGNAWKYVTSAKKRLPAGRYEVKVRATDNSGVVAQTFTAAAKTLLRFRIR